MDSISIDDECDDINNDESQSKNSCRNKPTHRPNVPLLDALAVLRTPKRLVICPRAALIGVGRHLATHSRSCGRSSVNNHDVNYNVNSSRNSTQQDFENINEGTAKEEVLVPEDIDARAVVISRIHYDFPIDASHSLGQLCAIDNDIRTLCCMVAAKHARAVAAAASASSTGSSPHNSMGSTATSDSLRPRLVRSVRSVRQQEDDSGVEEEEEGGGGGRMLDWDESVFDAEFASIELNDRLGTHGDRSSSTGEENEKKAKCSSASRHSLQEQQQQQQQHPHQAKQPGTTSIEKSDSVLVNSPLHGTVWACVALVGLIPLVDGPALIVATQRQRLASIYRAGLFDASVVAASVCSDGSRPSESGGSGCARHDVFRVSDFAVIPVSHETFGGALGVQNDFADDSGDLQLQQQPQQQQQQPPPFPPTHQSSATLAPPPPGDFSSPFQGLHGGLLTAAELVDRVQHDHLELLNDFLHLANLHYSYTTDITTHTQRHNLKRQPTPGHRKTPASRNAWQCADARFFWNARLLAPLIRAGAFEFCVPMMDSFISSFSAPIVVEVDDATAKMQVEYLLISRRSCARQGARYHTRGSDGLGNVANFAEAEQIISVVSTDASLDCIRGYSDINASALSLASYVITRGSIPTIWTQSNKGMKPKPEVSFGVLSADAMRAHFAQMNAIYRGRCVCVSLIDKHGTEADLGAEFETQIRNLPNFATSSDSHDHMTQRDVRYVGFDFHAECKTGWHHLSKLTQSVEADLDDCGFFVCGPSRTIQEQQGVFRVNCIDCLDRTNVVKSLFARRSVPAMLQQLANYVYDSSTRRVCVHVTSGGVEPLDPSSITSSHGPEKAVARLASAVVLCNSMESKFKHAWADNADAMSEAYTGTGALKADFTRTGKRSVKGIANDATNSLKRFYNQQYLDKARQASVDFFTGQVLAEPFYFAEPGTVFPYVRRIHLSSHEIALLSTGFTESETLDTEHGVSDEEVMLIFDSSRRILIEYSLLSLRQRIFGLSSLCAVFAPGKRSLSLAFTIQTHPRVYVFETVEEGRRFRGLLESMARGSLRRFFSSDGIERSFLVGNWDMEAVRSAPDIDDITRWLGRGLGEKRISLAGVVVCLQNCDYTPPATLESISTAAGHMRLLIQLHLGPEFVCTHVASVYSKDRRKVHATKRRSLGESSVELADGESPGEKAFTDTHAATGNRGPVTQMFIFVNQQALCQDVIAQVQLQTSEYVACSRLLTDAGAVASLAGVKHQSKSSIKHAPVLSATFSL